VSRPITLKKDGIQTRNRKLAAKAKKRRHGMMHDFLRPLDSHSFSAAYQQAMGSTGYLGAAAGSMSQYYASNFGHPAPMTSQFASGMGYHPHHAGGMAGPAASAFSFGSAASHMSAAMPASLMAGAMA
jgi:hypothetical protein